MVSADTGRCWWSLGDPLLTEYHDNEWGMPASDDTHLFEMLTLEGFQAGLSWLTILRKRSAFRAAFAGFDPHAVAAFNDEDRARLMADAGIVRNRAKIDATIANAAAFLSVAERDGSFAAFLGDRFPPPPRRLPADATSGSLPATTPESDALSREFKKLGFRFVGSTIAYSFMQAVGLVDDHVPGCFRYVGETT
ncbi:MAG TPA: DNA-3-methyladenine glycosylase I [Candidatus Limnocylindrales bacterium]